MDRGDTPVAVAEARDRRAAGGVEIAPALGVDDLDAGAGNRDRHVDVCGAMQDMRHGRNDGGVGGGLGPVYSA